MLTIKDIKNLTEYLKEVFVTKEDFHELKGSIFTLQSSVDAALKDKDNNEKTRIISDYRIKNLEGWVSKAAPKVGVDFQR